MGAFVVRLCLGLLAPLVAVDRCDRDADKIDTVFGDLHDAAYSEPNHNSPLAQQIHSLKDWCREP